MINFALGLNLDVNKPSIWIALSSDCCTASGVTCVGQRVTQIVWNNNGLDGSMNGTAIPNGLMVLSIEFNSLSGGILYFLQV